MKRLLPTAGAVMLMTAGVAMGASTPYSGTPAAVPGTIQAENFDRGGEGVAYHDLVRGNAGGQYRTSKDVDIINSADSAGGGYVVNNFQTGEWLAYTVNVASSGQYDVELRAASAYSSSAYHIEIDGQNVTGRITVPNTGSWNNFQWLGKKRVSVRAGTHVVKIVAEQEYFDLNSFRMLAAPASTSTPYTGTPAAVPGTIEAENFDRGGEGVAYHDVVAGNAGGQYRASEEVDIVTSSDSAGGGYVVNNFQTGEWLAYTVNVAGSGQYDVELRASSAFSTSAFHVEIDGQNVTGRVSVPNTGNWPNFQWLGKTRVSLTAGTHVMKVFADQEYFDLNSIRVSAPTATTTTPPDPTTVKFFCTFPSSPADCGFSEQSKVAGRASLTSVARDGLTGLRLHTEPGDNNVAGSGDMERDDVWLSQQATDGYEGREQWWAHSILFPSDFAVPTWQNYVLLDFHNTTAGAWQANFHVLFQRQTDTTKPGLLTFLGYGGVNSADGRYSATIGEIQKNVWYDFVYHVKWSSGPDGLFEAWVNGKKMLSHTGPNMYAGQGVYLKLANYHVPVCDPYPGCTGPASSVIHDRVIRGTTPQAVSAGPLEGVVMP